MANVGFIPRNDTPKKRYKLAIRIKESRVLDIPPIIVSQCDVYAPGILRFTREDNGLVAHIPLHMLAGWTVRDLTTETPE